MFKIIIYLIIAISILHFILYYYNFDFDFDTFNYFKKDNIQNEYNASIKYSNDNNSISNDILIDSINELKTLNECINNGEINTSFS